MNRCTNCVRFINNIWLHNNVQNIFRKTKSFSQHCRYRHIQTDSRWVWHLWSSPLSSVSPVYLQTLCSDLIQQIKRLRSSSTSVPERSMTNFGDFVIRTITEAFLSFLPSVLFFLLSHCVKSYSLCLIGSRKKSLRLIKLSLFALRLVRNPLKKIASNSTSCWAEVWELRLY